MNDIGELKVIATHHAKERLEQMEIPFRRAVYLIKTGKEEKGYISKYKKQKYGDKQDGVFFIRNGSAIFTLKIEPNKHKEGENVLILITATDQKATIKDPKAFSWDKEQNSESN